MRPNLRSIVHRRIHRETSAIVWAATGHFECPLSHNTIMAEQNTYQELANFEQKLQKNVLGGTEYIIDMS